MSINLSLFILLALLASWEEINQLIREGSWEPIKKDFWIPIWQTAWDGKWKLFDSHHLSYGLFVLVMFIFLQYHDNKAITLNILGNFKDVALILIHWWLFFYIRNLGMHIIFRKRNRQWKYLSPIQF